MGYEGQGPAGSVCALRVRVVATLPRIGEALRETAARAGAMVLDSGPGSAMAPQDAGEAEVVLGWYADLDANECQFIRSRGGAVVMALTTDRLLEASQQSPDPDGWIFLDRQQRHARSILELSRAGHCVVPASISSLDALDVLRLQRLSVLTAQELQVLACLGEGMPNRRIAGLLGISEASTKYVVRSVLTKLRLSNRTSAGVFAACHPRQ